MVRRYVVASLLWTAAALATPALAEDAGDAGEQTEIIVTGTLDGYRTIDTTSGTKTSAPILDVPQSISVVTSDQIADQNIRSMAELVRLIPGVSAGQGEGHRDQITLRGNNSTADFFVDGLRDDVQYFRSFYNIDRVEAHKGPNAMIFGRGGGGGVINRISKGALADTRLIAGNASVDSFGARAAAADINAPLGTGVATRINGFYEELNNHRDAYEGHRLGINPVVGAQIGDWKVQLGYEYVSDDRVVDRGIPSFSGRPAKGFREQFFGTRGVNLTEFEGHVVSFRSVAALTDALKFSTQFLYGDYDKFYANAFAATPLSATNTLGVEAYSDATRRKNFIGQANLEWTTSFAGMDHLVLIGAEATDQKTGSERINGFFSPTVLGAANRRATIVLADPLPIPTIFFVAGPLGNSNRKVQSQLSQVSAYIQDQIKLGGGFEFIGGLRYDKLDIAVTNQFTNVRVKRVDDLWSPRAGLVFKPVPQASLYLSYSKSYLPQSGDQFLSFDATFAALKPETFDNYEIGAKWDIKTGLTATLALYRLDRSNTRATGPTPGSVVLTGKQRSKGVEFGLTGKISPVWQTSLGYAHTLAEITQTTTAAPAGRKIGQVPKHQLSLWNRYDATEKLGLGLGLYHQSKSFTTISNTVILPGYTRLDAALFYKLSDSIEAQLNLENVGGARYFPVAQNDNNITPGAPFNARFTIAVKL